jgi:hypothetical protein
MNFDEFKTLFDDFVVNVLNKTTVEILNSGDYVIEF